MPLLYKKIAVVLNIVLAVTALTDCGNKEKKDALAETRKGRYVEESAQIRQVLIEVVPEYLKGAKSLETTLDEIEGGLKMYLAK